MEVSTAASSEYPYGKILKHLVQELKLTGEEIVGFLRLIPEPSEAQTTPHPSSDNLQQRIKSCMEVWLIATHDFGDRAVTWINEPNEWFDGHSPRELMLRHPTQTIIDLVREMRNPTIMHGD